MSKVYTIAAETPLVVYGFREDIKQWEPQDGCFKPSDDIVLTEEWFHAPPL